MPQTIRTRSSVVELAAFNREVEGSSPSGCTNGNKTKMAIAA